MRQNIKLFPVFEILVFVLAHPSRYVGVYQSKARTFCKGAWQHAAALEKSLTRENESKIMVTEQNKKL
jgi:hypothetical protein